MAKQNGHIKFKGTIDDLTYYKSEDGHIVRARGGVDGERILNDPNYERLREHISEFKLVANAGKLIRSTLGTLILTSKDSKLVPRITGLLNTIKKLDMNSQRGTRNVTEGLALDEGKKILLNFEFNQYSKLSTVLQSPYTYDPNDGTINFPELEPKQQLFAPDGATHFKLKAGYARIDFATNQTQLIKGTETILPLNADPTGATIQPVNGLPQGSGVLFVILGVDFYMESGNAQYPMKGNNAMAIIHIG